MNLPDIKELMNIKIGIFLTLPFVLAIPPVLGWLIGTYLDKILDTKPVFMYVFIILGFIGGFREMFRLINRFKDDV